MTQTSTAARHAPRPLSAHSPGWVRFAHSAIDRLRLVEHRLIALEDAARAGDGEAIDALAAYREDDRPRPAVRWTPKRHRVPLPLPDAPRHPPEDGRVNSDAGGEVGATDEAEEAGRARGDVALPLPDLLLVIRLAATLGDAQTLQSFLAPGAVTVLHGLGQSRRLSKILSGCFLPEGWQASAEALRGKPGVLLVPEHPLDSGKLTRSLVEHAPLLLSLRARDEIPELLAGEHPSVRILEVPPLDRVGFEVLLGVTHGATGRDDRAAVRAALPGDEALADLGVDRLVLALRAPTAAAAAAQIARALGGQQPGPAVAPEAPDPAMISGSTPAHRAARDLMSDLLLWKDGRADWSDLSRSLLVHGQPGTGKTHLAREMARRAGVPLVQGSFAAWQAAGHLGLMLAAMTASFDEAIASAPCVLFIDEIDAAGSRFSPDPHNSNYRVQVINGFLQQIDRLADRPGVILVGACNAVETLDPAILRAGRFDETVEMPLPGSRDIAAILRHGLADMLPEADLREIAREAIGKTPADLDAAVRAAKARARRASEPLSARHLRDQLDLEAPDPAYLHRIAVHEAGHAICMSLLRPGSVKRLSLSVLGGRTEWRAPLSQGTVEDFEAELSIHMSGRAAERLVLGSVTGGAGGGAQSDLAKATRLALGMDRELGLGRYGSAWLGPADLPRLGEDERQRVRARLDLAERRARTLLEPRRDALTTLASTLVQARELEGDRLHCLLRGLPAPEAPHE